MLSKSILLCFVWSFSIFITINSKILDRSTSKLAASLDGNEAFQRGVDLNSVGRFEEASDMFWVAIMRHGSVDDPSYDATDAFTRYLNTYMKRDILEEGYLSVAVKYIASGQAESGVHFVLQALDVDPTNEHALTLLKEHGDKKSYKNALSKAKAASHHVATTDPSNDPTDMSNRRKSDGAVKQSFNSEWKTVIKNEPNNAKAHLELAAQHFADHDWIPSLYHYDVAYKLSKSKSDEYYQKVRSIAKEVQYMDFFESNSRIRKFYDEFDSAKAVNADACYGASAYLRSTLALWGNASMEQNSLTCSGNEVCKSDLNSDTFFYDRDVMEVENIIRREKNSSMLLKTSAHQASAVHPHMTLGFPMDADLRLAVAVSHAEAESALVRQAGVPKINHETPAMLKRYNSLAFKGTKNAQKMIKYNNKHNSGVKNKLNHDEDSRTWDWLAMGLEKSGKTKKSKTSRSVPSVPAWSFETPKDSKSKALPFVDGYRIKVGYVSANIKAKSTVYMAQDLMRFHDRTRFEVHVYATTPQDTDSFLNGAMRGVDWREKVRHGVEYFHEVADLDVKRLSERIMEDGIHILLNWDGYSNNGVRATGLFPIQAAPIQIAHQEYIGTMGAADYIQYLIADEVAIPLEYTKYYTESMLYMPHSFLATSFAYQRPYLSDPPRVHDKYNNPKVNACGRSVPAAFVYCNFNKHLKFSPHMFKVWLRALETVDDSVLCLLENPSDSVPYIKEFVRNYNESLSDRVRFQPFINNPYDNQRRVSLMCNAILDTRVYNGHTTAGDALWGGVPIVTYGEDVEMAGRVGKSALTALGLPELIVSSMSAYYDLAVRLAVDSSYYTKIRNKLIDTTTSTNPRNPFWDLRRYVRSLENGYEQIWRHFLEFGTSKPTHIYAKDPLNAPTNSRTNSIGSKSHKSNKIIKEMEPDYLNSKSKADSISSRSLKSKKSKSKKGGEFNKVNSKSSKKSKKSKKAKKAKKAKK